MDPVILVLIFNICLLTVSAGDFHLSTSSSNATAGLNFSFICTVGHFGTRFTKNEQSFCLVDGLKDGKCDTESCDDNVDMHCNVTTYTMTLHGNFVNDVLHKSTWSCNSLFAVGKPSNVVTLYVNVPISKVIIRAMPTDGNPIEIITGTKQTFQCTTDGGRPSSSIQWYISGTNITDSASVQPDVCNSACNDKVTSSSILTYTGTREDEGKNIYCTAVNTKNQIKRSQNRTVVILYGPGKVTIVPSSQIYTVTENSDIIPPIKCTADCKPNCRMTWNGPNIPDGITAELVLTDIKRNQAGKYYCKASNNAWSNTSVTINVIVEYGPNNVSISPTTQTYTVTEKIGSVGPIFCMADCRPNCTMTWNGPGLKIGHSSILNLTKIARNQEGNYQCTATNGAGSLKSVIVFVNVNYGPGEVFISPSIQNNTVTESGKFGPINCSAVCKPECSMNWSGPNLKDGNTSVLVLHQIDRDNAGHYICNASNYISSQTSVTVNVIVNYGPRTVRISPTHESYVVKEKIGSVNPINCTANCKPDCSITWYGPDLPAGTTSVLILRQIQKTQAGNYTCIASNYVGNQESKIVRIVVHYGPDHVTIVPSKENYTVNETKSVDTIFCSSDCKPSCKMTWTGPNIPAGTTSELNLLAVDKNQAGNYTCTALNEVGQSTSRIVNIIVNFRPTVIYIRGNQTYNENDTVVFSYNVESVPAATINWIFEDRILDNVESVSATTGSEDRIIKIRHVGCLSMGTYNCSAMNLIGLDTKAIEIVITCSPRMNNLEYNVSKLIAVKDQEPLNITAPIIAFPKPYIYWTLVKNDSFVNVTHKTSNIFKQNRAFSNLYIENVTEADFGFYRIYAFNEIEKQEGHIYSFNVIPERKPNPPNDITCIGRPESVLVNWKSNFNGGRTQTFQIYIQKDGDEKFISYGQNYTDPGQNQYSDVLVNKLKSDTSYHVKVRASNIHSYSMSEAASCNTTSEVLNDQRSKNTAVIGAGTGIGAAIVLLIIGGVVICFIRRRQNNDKLGQDKELINRGVVKESDNDEDGLRENPLYISSAKEDVGAVYSTVNKDKDDKSIYTQVVKKPKRDIRDKDIEMGCVYENPEDISHDHADDVYANSEVKTKVGDKDVYITKKNKDGLIYADLDLAPTMNGRRFVIRGLENRNNYAVIDLTKTAEPLPSDSDNDDDKKEQND